MTSWGRRGLVAYAVALVVWFVLLATVAPSSWTSLFVLAVLVGVATSAVTIVVARAHGRRASLAAVAMLVCLVPGTVGILGFYLTLSTSEAAGGWISRASALAFFVALLTALAALVWPARRRLAVIGCVTAGLLPVVVAVPMIVVAATAEGRHASALDQVPVDGPARPPSVEENSVVGESADVTRVWEASGVACDGLATLVEEWAGLPARSVEQPLVLPHGSCTVEALGTWTGRRAAVLPDGRLVVSVWSPTADLFSF